MANNPRFSDVAVNAEADAFARLLNDGYLRIYDGAQPANADTAVAAQKILAELRFSAKAFQPAVAGLVTAAAITADPDARATGDASWFRALKADGVTTVMDGSVGLDGADCTLDIVAVEQHAQVSCVSLSIQVSKG